MDEMWVPVKGNPQAPQRRKRRIPVAVRMLAGGLVAAGAWWGTNALFHANDHRNGSSAQVAAPFDPAVEPFASQNPDFTIKFPTAVTTTSGADLPEVDDAEVMVFESGSVKAGYMVTTYPLYCSSTAPDIDNWLMSSADDLVAASHVVGTSTSTMTERAWVSIGGQRGLQTAYIVAGKGFEFRVDVAFVFAGPHSYTIRAVNAPAGSWDPFLGSFKSTAEPVELPPCESPTNA